MNNKPTFEKTVNILVKAYLNDTLVHGYCTACAVGNIIASSMGLKLIHDPHSCAPDWETNETPKWPSVFLCTGDDHTMKSFQSVCPMGYKGRAKEEIDSTGYSWQELARIEFAFEAVPYEGTRDERMFNGLMNVINVLAEIHNVDLSVKEQAKLLFAKP